MTVDVNYAIRPVAASEIPLLNDFLYEAIFIPEGSEIPPRDIIYKPELQIYVTEFGQYKDFGFGFYCTNYEHQAKKWALTRRENHIVNVYEYTEKAMLKMCRFHEMTEEWLDFIVNCRRGVEHCYDIVEGPMADDTIWDYIEDYVRGTITKEAFWVLVKFKYPTHQIVFCTQKALSTLRYERSYPA